MAESIWRKDISRDISTQSLARLAGAFGDWYVAQAKALLPASTLAWLLDRGERKLIVRSQADGGFVCFVGDDLTPADGAGDGSPPVSPREWLTRFSSQKHPAKVILELPREKFFVRSFDAPAAARAALPQLLPNEITRKTLFKLEDIFYGHVVGQSPKNPGKLHVTQWILRRDIAQAALESAGLSLADLDLVRPSPGADGGDGGDESPQIAVGQNADCSTWFRRTLIAMAALGLCLLIGAAAMQTWRVYRTGTQLDEEIAVAARQAGVVRNLADQATAESALLSGLRRQREKTPTLADLLEETARVLPDSAYLHDWRLSEQKPDELRIDMAGMADAAADLPALLDTSPMFFDTTLTTAIMPDAQEKRERFSLQTRVRVKNLTIRE